MKKGKEKSRFRELRQNRSLTQVNVSTKIGIDQSDYSKIERGMKPISLQTAIKVARFYGTSIDYVVGLTNEPTPYPWVQKEN